MSSPDRVRRRALLAAIGFVLVLTAVLGGPPARAQTTAPQPSVDTAQPEEPASDASDPDAPQAENGAVPEVPAVPDVVISVDAEDSGMSRTVALLVLMTVGSVAPALLLLTTTFTRFVVVLGLAKQAIGAQTVPPAQVLIGLALFLTFFVMAPTFSQINADAVQPLLAGEITEAEAIEAGVKPLREFMLAQTREEDLALFVGLAGDERPASPDDVATTTLVPAFVVSELRTAFVIGFVVFVPFVMIDLVVASILMSLGMVMLPPVFVSLPIKILLFVLVDGWSLIVGSLVDSVQPVL